MNLRQFDLNLLVALDVLLTERNVTRASERLFLSQPAVSVILARLRHADAIGKGLTLEQVQAARLARDYDGRYATAGGPASADGFVATVYRSLTATAR